MRGHGADDVRWDGGAEPVYRLAITLVAVVVRLVFRVRVVGASHLPRTGAALLAPNHLSYWDPVLLAVVCHRLGRRVRFFAQAPLFERPSTGWLMRGARQIPVRRGVGAAQGTAKVREALAAGEVVVVYPEGTIPRPGTRPPARPGLGVVALRCRAPVIPVTMWGVEQPRGWRRLLPWTRAAVVLGAPLDLDRWHGRDDDVAAQQVADTAVAQIRSAVPLAQRLVDG